MFNNNGSGHLIADVVGWFPPTAAGYSALSLALLLELATHGSPGSCARSAGVGRPAGHGSRRGAELGRRRGRAQRDVDAVVGSELITVWPTGKDARTRRR